MAGSEVAPRRGGIIRNFVHLGLGQVTTTVLTILLNATMGRVLSASDFGLLFLLTSIASFTYVFVDWGYGPLIIRETARHPGKAGELLGSALTLRTLGVLMACPVAVAVTWVLGYDLRTRLLSAALILGLLPQYLGLSFGWVFRGYELMGRDALINVALKLLTLIGSVSCLLLGGRLLALVAVWTVAGGMTLIFALSMYRKLRLPALTATRTTGLALLRDGAPIFAMMLTGAIEPFVNANILFKMSSPSVVGWYGAAMTIAGTLIAPASILAMTMYPRLSTTASNPAEFKHAFETSFRPLVLLAVLGVVGTYLFADVAVGIIYGLEKFGPAADILRAFAPVLLLMYVDMLLATAILAAGKSSRLAMAKVASIVVATALVFVLVPLCQARYANGGLGVMFAMLSGEFLMLLAAVLLIRDNVGGHSIGDLIRSLLAGAATVMLFRFLPALNAFVAVPLCVIAFGAASLLVGAVKWADVRFLVSKVRKRRATVDG